MAAFSGADMVSVGAQMIAGVTSGIVSGTPAMVAAAAAAGSAASSAMDVGSAVGHVGRSGIGGGTSSDAIGRRGGTTINVSGHVINSGRGYDGLGRQIEHRAKSRGRGPMRYRDTD
jgi:hypothetical protein